MDYDRGIDTMQAFFAGKIGKEFLARPEPKQVELGHGSGIGQKDGSYSQYIQKLSEQAQKGNGIVYIGNAINIDKNMYSILNPVDKFSIGEIPKVLILYYNIMKDITLKTVWKDDADNIILEQYYEIPSAHSLGYDWWDQYGVYFIGPEKLEEGDYKVEITSYQSQHIPGYGNKFNTLTIAVLEYSVEDIDNLSENIEKSEPNKIEKTENEQSLSTLNSSKDIKMKEIKTKEITKEINETKEIKEMAKIKNVADKEDIDVYKIFGMK